MDDLINICDSVTLSLKIFFNIVLFIFMLKFSYSSGSIFIVFNHMFILKSKTRVVERLSFLI